VTEDVHAGRRARAAARLRGRPAPTGSSVSPVGTSSTSPASPRSRASDTSCSSCRRPIGALTPRRWRPDRRRTDPPRAGPPRAGPYETQVKEETTVGAVRTWADGDDPTAAVQDLLGDLGLSEGRLLVDDTMWATFTQDLRAARARRGVGTRERGARRPPRAEGGRGRVGRARAPPRRPPTRRSGTSAISARTRSG